MVAYWTSDEYKKKHEDGQTTRAVMAGGSHCQGSLPLEVSRRREAKKTGVEPNFFDFWERKRLRKEPHPLTGSKWLNKGAETRSIKFVEKFKEVHGDDVDPRAAPFDPEVAVLAGQGARNGRLWIGDGSVNPATIPTLSRLRKGRTSSQPSIETRPRLGVIAMDQLREEVAEERRLREEEVAEERRRREEEAAEERRRREEMEQRIAQQEQMLAQQKQMMEWMKTTMVSLMPSGTTIPTFTFPFSQSSVGGSNHAPQGQLESPLTPPMSGQQSMNNPNARALFQDGQHDKP